MNSAETQVLHELAQQFKPLLIRQCAKCHRNRNGFCTHYRKRVNGSMPYPDWEYCNQHNGDRVKA